MGTYRFDFEPSAHNFPNPLDTTISEAYEEGARNAFSFASDELLDIADSLMGAHENEDWQEIAHIALDVIPRIFKDYIK